MSSIMKVFLLLAVMVCISEAQQPAESCMCQRVRNKLVHISEIKDIQIYQPTIFCNRMEIVVTNKSGLRYCLNPELKAVQRLIASFGKQKPSTTAGPTVLTPTIGCANTAHV